MIARVCNKCSFNSYTQDGSMKTENMLQEGLPGATLDLPDSGFYCILNKSEQFKPHQN